METIGNILTNVKSGMGDQVQNQIDDCMKKIKGTGSEYESELDTLSKLWKEKKISDKDTAEKIKSLTDTIKNQNIQNNKQNALLNAASKTPGDQNINRGVLQNG